MWLKNYYFRVGLILGLFIVSLLVVMPRTPITYSNRYLDIDTQVGGYNLNLFNGRILLNLTQFKRGLDLAGGMRLVLKADMDKINPNDRDAALESAREVIERRINFLGVSEPYIVPSKVGGEYRIVVEIPGVSDMSTAVASIGQTAQLQFKQLREDAEWDDTKFQEYYTDPTVWVDTDVSGADLRGVDVVYSEDFSGNTIPQVQLRFSNEGRKKFEELAKNNINRPVALFLDESSVPLSMPVVSPDLAEGLINDPIISGNFDADTARRLSVQLRAGALPVPVRIIEQTSIGATLGDESVQKSLRAGMLGMGLVLIFMMFIYGKLGIIADFALVLYSLIVLSIFKIIPVTLTLPGIAGFLLSVGMAVDANILIFERVREEIEWGRPRSLAINFGFDRAWTSIRDSNVSSLITSAILFQFGTGPVRGFALTLAIGIVVSMFTAIFVTRTLIRSSGIYSSSRKTGERIIKLPKLKMPKIRRLNG
jgi:preprotein translocase subunit SecD